MGLLRFVFVVSCVFASVFGFPTSDQIEDSALSKVYRVIQDCSNKDLTMCLKMRALTYVDKALRRSEDINIVDGVTLVKADSSTEAYRGLNARALSQDELDASLPKNADEKNTQIENMLFDRVARFLETHTLMLKVPESSISEMKRSLEEARDKKKKAAKKILPALAMMLIFKVIASIPFILGTLALLAFKALLIGKIALVLSAIIGLKKLLDSKHHHQTYEVVAHPHHSEEHGHYAARSLNDAQEMAYSAYVPNKVD